MNAVEAQGTVKHFIKTLTEITVYTTTILGYILALMGRVPGELSSYSTTVATLAFLISLAVLWGWRWSLITKKRSTDSMILVADMDNRVVQSPRNPFGGPFASSGSYVMPLGQRRLEGTILLVLTVFAMGVTGIRIPQITGEFSGLYCLNNDPDALRIIIADFNPPDGSRFEDSLANRIYLHRDVKLEICRYTRPTVLLVNNAENTGKTYKAALVIWGINSDGLMDVYFTPTADWAISEPLEDGLVAKDSKNEVAFLAEQVAAEILFFQGRYLEAQRNLSAALENADQLGNINSELLADGHFFLGLLFDPDQYPDHPEVSDLPRSIREYSMAIRWNEGLENAYLNRASLYKRIGDTEKAIADYNTLIRVAKNPDYKFDGYFQEADLLIGKQLCLPAVADLEAALQTSGVEEYYLYPDLVHLLGKAYLLCKKYDVAERTYRKLSSLETAELPYFVTDLNQFAGEYPEDQRLQEEVANIIKFLELEKSP